MPEDFKHPVLLTDSLLLLYNEEKVSLTHVPENIYLPKPNTEDGFQRGYREIANFPSELKECLDFSSWFLLQNISPLLPYTEEQVYKCSLSELLAWKKI